MVIYAETVVFLTALKVSLLFTGTNAFKLLEKTLREIQKNQEKEWLSQVFFFSYLAMLLWHGLSWTTCRKVSVRICSVEENERGGWKGGLVTECFIISNVAFPEALSKVSEQREPGARNVQPPCDHLEQSNSPLSYFRPQTRASAWIMCLNTVALFIWLDFSLACLKA